MGNSLRNSFLALFVLALCLCACGREIEIPLQQQTDVAAPTKQTPTVQAASSVNSAPLAVNDAFNVIQGTPTLLNVLANDSDADGDTLIITLFDQPSQGTITLESGKLRYTSNAGFTGLDGAAYQISDGRGGTSLASVIIGVQPANRPPVAVLDTAFGILNEAVCVDVLANDYDPDNSPPSKIGLTVTSVSNGVYGTATLENNKVCYTQHSKATQDTLIYFISDGAGGTNVGNLSMYVF
jgi:large repetitive protein